MKYRIGADVVWARVSREAIDDDYGLSGEAAQVFAEEAEVTCGQIGVWLADLEHRGQRTADRYMVDAALFQTMMGGLA